MRRALIVAWLVLAPAAAGAQVDFSGEWRAVTNEVDAEGPEIGDYTGLPINAEARAVAEAWDASVLSLPELQCRPHPAPYAERTPGNPANAQMRWWKEVDPATQELTAYRKRGAWMEPERTIWMDGRPHPPEYAPHTWQGFSTGQWQGNTLVVRTTHIKEGFLRRNGVPHSDKLVMTEYFVRHGSYLTSNLYVEDPVYLEEPLLRNSIWVLDARLADLHNRYPCGPNEIVIEVVRPKGEVPHYLPGTNTMLRDFAARFRLPFEATRGGAESIYPEYMNKLKTMPPVTRTSGQ